MSEEQQPLTIEMLAADVLRYLDHDYKGPVKLELTEISYVRVEQWEGDGPIDLQQLALSGVECHVCALGAFLVAQAIREDAIDLNFRTNGYLYIEDNIYLPRLPLDKASRTRVEAIFEGWSPMRYPWPFEEERPASARDRLRIICQAIVDGNKFWLTGRTESAESELPQEVAK